MKKKKTGFFSNFQANTLLLSIPFFFVLIFMGVSVVRLVTQAFFDENGFTMEYIFHLFHNKAFIRILLQTLYFAFLTASICIITVYPVAYLSVKAKSRLVRQTIHTIMLANYSITVLAKCFSLYMLLQKNGALNYILKKFGIIQESLELMYTKFAVVLGLIFSLIPFAYLSLIAVMKDIDSDYLLVSQTMGAKPSQGFFRVFLPLSAKGIFSGFLMIFILTLGYYGPPALLGGPDSMMISLLIRNNVDISLNWHVVGAMSIVTCLITIILLFIIFKFFGLSIFIPDEAKGK